MRKLILSWLLAVVSVGGCATYAKLHATPPPPTTFELVCEKVVEEYGDTCEGIEPPVLVITGLVSAVGAYGVYVHDEQYIFVAPFLPNTREVIIHETVHYVLWELYISRTNCDSERHAREWTAAITGKPVDESWEKRYRCAK